MERAVRLVVVEGPNRGAVLPLPARRNRLGRDPGLEVPLLDERVSRVHAEVLRDERGLTLRDLGSRNGTRKNGVRCEEAPLAPGDELRLGDLVLLVVDEGSALEAAWSRAGRATRTATRGDGAGQGGVEAAPAGAALPTAPPPLLGESDAWREVERLVARAAPLEATVLVTGESGTGKELVARAIHHNSPRRAGPFVALNAATLEGDLLASELFGHEAGAFTGAAARRLGVFELARGGTLFLDEVGDLALASQAALLRVLEKQGFRRLGGSELVVPVVRLLAATHVDLEVACRRGAFREDLFFRLAALTIRLPPLRERRGDVPHLARHFLRAVRGETGRPARELSPAALAALEAHPFPGNVRELRNVIERVSITCEAAVVDAADLPLEVRAPAPRPASPPAGGGEFPSLRDVEREHIARALRRAEGNKSQAARLLGIDRVTLYARLKRHGLQA